VPQEEDLGLSRRGGEGADLFHRSGGRVGSLPLETKGRSPLGVSNGKAGFWKRGRGGGFCPLPGEGLAFPPGKNGSNKRTREEASHTLPTEDEHRELFPGSEKKKGSLHAQRALIKTERGGIKPSLLKQKRRENNPPFMWGQRIPRKKEDNQKQREEVPY